MKNKQAGKKRTTNIKKDSNRSEKKRENNN